MGIIRRRSCPSVLQTYSELSSSMDAVVEDTRTGGEDFCIDPEFGKQMRANVSSVVAEGVAGRSTESVPIVLLEKSRRQ